MTSASWAPDTPTLRLATKNGTPRMPIALAVEEVSVEVWRERTSRHDEADED